MSIEGLFTLLDVDGVLLTVTGKKIPSDIATCTHTQKISFPKYLYLKYKYYIKC